MSLANPHVHVAQQLSIAGRPAVEQSNRPRPQLERSMGLSLGNGFGASGDDELARTNSAGDDLSRRRTHYADINAAMESFGLTVERRRAARHLLRDVRHDTVWMPRSRIYVALAWKGQIVAWVYKSFVECVQQRGAITRVCRIALVAPPADPRDSPADVS